MHVVLLGAYLAWMSARDLGNICTQIFFIPGSRLSEFFPRHVSSVFALILSFSSSGQNELEFYVLIMAPIGANIFSIPLIFPHFSEKRVL